VLELPVMRHPFFFATLYQPERSALEGRKHPLIAAYLHAALAAHNRADEFATSISRT
jgi:CTP synthase (UTP-ammonia lyase)